jgi:hypothetical protein
MDNKLKVGELLVHAGVVDEQQLEAALAEQQQWGRRLGVTLIKLGMVEENDLVRALAQQLGIPATSLDGRRIAPEVIALVPARIATHQAVVPLFVQRSGNAGKLFLAMEDPSKLEVLDDLCFRTGLEIQPVMMGPTELGRALDRYYTTTHEISLGTSATESSGETTISERSLGLPAPRTANRKDGSLELASRAERKAPQPEQNLERGRELSIGEIGGDLSADFGVDVDRVARDSEKTRLVVKAVVQLLVDKQILTLDEIQTRVRELERDAVSN